MPVDYVANGLEEYFLAAQERQEARGGARKPLPTAQDLYDAATNAGTDATEPKPAKRAKRSRKTKYVGRHRPDNQ